jgi:membrane peptidoglycan carboxypeptidase
MLEVYFNIIEWGPNVYGIGEASQFYFQKSPANLNLNECLFLATIIPSPKKFMTRFDVQQKLKTYANQQNAFLTKLMLRRNVITANDTIGNFPLYISGAAKMYLKQNNKPVENDSLSVEDFDF